MRTVWPYISPHTDFEDYSSAVNTFVQQSLKKSHQVGEVIHSILRASEIVLNHQHHSFLLTGDVLETYRGRKRCMIRAMVKELQTIWPCEYFLPLSPGF